jgi:Holliday junction resolvasome RuvABC endonuclease subunit
VKVIQKYIWAFDLSMDDSGIVIFDLQGNPVHICSIKTNDKQTHGDRLKYIADKVLELRKEYPAKTIVIERGFSQFNTSTQVIFRVHGIINYLFYDCKQIYYPPKKVKSFILNGNATKKQLKDEIKRRYPDIEFHKIEKKDKKTKNITIEENENESDAFAVGLTYFIDNKILK